MLPITYEITQNHYPYGYQLISLMIQAQFHQPTNRHTNVLRQTTDDFIRQLKPVGPLNEMRQLVRHIKSEIRPNMNHFDLIPLIQLIDEKTHSIESSIDQHYKYRLVDQHGRPYKEQS